MSPDHVPTQYGQSVRLVSVGKRLGLRKQIPVVPPSVDFKARGNKPSSLNSISAETDYILSLLWAHCHLVDVLYPLRGELAAD